MLGKTNAPQIQLDGLFDHFLRLKMVIFRVFTVAVQINSHGKGLSHSSENVKTSGQDRAVGKYCCDIRRESVRIKKQRRKWADLKQDNLLTITESASAYR
jgi:hypothetical protein